MELQSQKETDDKGSHHKNNDYELVLYDNDNDGEKKFNLEDGKDAVVGFSAKCDIQVDDDNISSQHFSISKHGDDFQIKDLCSLTGLYLLVDKPMEINPDQIFIAGKKVFWIQQKITS